MTAEVIDLRGLAWRRHLTFVAVFLAFITCSCTVTRADVKGVTIMASGSMSHACSDGPLMPSVREMETAPLGRMPLPEVAPTEQGVYGSLTNGQRIARYLTPSVQSGLSAYAGALLREGSLSPGLREMIIVRVGYATASKYEVMQHRSLALRLGVSQEKLDGLACVEPSGLDSDERAALAFVDQLLSKNYVDDPTLQAVRASYGDGAAVEIIAVTGLWWTLSRMLTTAGVPLDDETIGDRDNEITRNK